MSEKSNFSQDGPSGKQKTTLLVLALLALGTVFLLPQFVSEPWITGQGGAESETIAPPPSSVAPSTAAEKTRYRKESQTVLANIIATRDRLTEQNVEAWAGIEFGQALAKIDAGDEKYSYGEYRESLDSYRQALDELSLLEENGTEKLSAAMTEVLAAIESLNINVANRAIETAATIDPEDQQVQDLVRRVASLPELAGQIESGDQARSAGQLSNAQSAYQAAVDLDPTHNRAVESLAAVKKEIIDSRFRQHMSRAYAALENGDFEAAKQAFRQADGIYPGHNAVKQGLAQVDNRDSQVLVSQKIARASDMESREEWGQALAVYETLLEEDPTLTGVKVKLIPVRVRRDLDEQLVRIIEDPLKLSNSSAYRSAQTTLNDARGITAPGEKLQGQIAELEHLLKLAVSPVNVVFQSDNLTQVTLFRVKELGQFDRTSLVLRPGRYIAAGTRKGFRDVRVEFTITGEPLEEPIIVRCEEPI